MCGEGDRRGVLPLYILDTENPITLNLRHRKRPWTSSTLSLLCLLKRCPLYLTKIGFPLFSVGFKGRITSDLSVP